MITPGTYRLVNDLPAIKPDRRKRHDWRASPVRAGTEMIVEKAFMPDHFRGEPPLRVYPRGEFSHYSVPLEETSMVLEPLEETPSRWLAREHRGLRLAVVFDMLVADGLLTLEQVKTYVENYSNRSEP